MGAVRSMVDTAWADIQDRFGPIADDKSLSRPSYHTGLAYFTRLKYPALFLTTDYVQQATTGVTAEGVSVYLNLVLVHTNSQPAHLEDDSLDYTDCLLELIRNEIQVCRICDLYEIDIPDATPCLQETQCIQVCAGNENPRAKREDI